MIPIYLISALIIILALQRKMKLILFLFLFTILSILYFFISDEILKFHPQKADISIYESFFLQYFPYILVATISFLIRFELKKDTELINDLKEKMNLLENKIHRIFQLSSKVRKDKREIEKRLISDEKESLKIRDIIYEISNFNTAQIDKNILKYFSKVIPSAKMSYYTFKENKLKYLFSNYETKEKIFNPELFQKIKNSEKSILTITDIKDLNDSIILIPIKINNENIYGVISVDEISFNELNRVTINNLSYFKELLSLQIKNSIIYKKQKENSFSYNEKNIYNYNFLKKLIDLEVSIAKRHNIKSSILILKSDSFIEIEKNEDEIFEKIENMYSKLFRKNDLIFYNNKNKNFVILLTLTDINKVKSVTEKIDSYEIDYKFEYEYIVISDDSHTNEIIHTLENTWLAG